LNAFDSIRHDIRYALRQLKQSPGFAAVAILSLALGIGANTAIFQLVDAVRLRTLPIQNPEELAYVDYAEGSARAGWWSTRSARMTWEVWKQIEERQQAFSGLAGWSARRFNLTTGGEARYAEGLFVNSDFFRTLGAAPVLGRVFGDSERGEVCGSNGAVISYSFWQSEFGGDPNVLSRRLKLDNHDFAIVGVTGPAFYGVEVGRRYHVAVPFCADPLLSEDGKGRMPLRHAWWISMMGRLKPGWNLEKAKAHFQTLSPGVMQASLPLDYKADLAKRYLANKLNITDGGAGVSQLRQRYERPLNILLAITGLVLLIACANLANLLLARASIREREVAVRLAIGASRGRLIVQFLAESMVLAVGGAVFGALIAQGLSRSLIAFLSTANNPLFVGLGIDLRVLGFTSLLALTTCILFGLLPAFRATRIVPAAAMRTGGRGTTAGAERFNLRRALVVTQVALSLVLLVGALLFVRSLRNLITTEAGFSTEGIIIASADFRGPNYPKERRLEVVRDLEARLAARPAIAAATAVDMTPLSGSGWDNEIGVDNNPAAASGKTSWFNRVSATYFRTMNTAILAGRGFNAHDNLTSPLVAVINEEFAKRYFPGKNPVGRTFRREAPAGKPETVYQIVGMMKNTKYYEIREEPRPIAYFPVSQNEDPGLGQQFLVRVRGPVNESLDQIKATFADVSPTIGLEFTFLSRQLEESLLRDRLMATLSASFGFLAALLATMGLYGVISYMVAKRRNEIGLRMALGADRGRVLWLVLREAVYLVGAGLVIGLGIALAAGRTASTLLYGLEPHDPLTLAASVVLLLMVAMAASYVPAYRASVLDPMTALRDE
jgi:putative ABC transport system permease protein